jgi:nucleoside-diphosphate-sugar epimerase
MIEKRLSFILPAITLTRAVEPEFERDDAFKPEEIPMSQGRLLITGATGMVGGLLTRCALEAGYTVRAMVRSTSNRDSLDSLDVEQFEADFADPETLPPALDDVDFVVNTAAHVGDWGPAEKFRAINVLALEHMLTAARRTGQLKRWVQISSLGVYAAKHHYGTDETTPADLSGLDGYTQTKAEAEVLLNRYIDEYDFPAVIMRPGFIYGPGDRHVVPRIIERLSAGQMKLIGDGKKVLNNTYAGNLTDSIMLALEKDEAIGETFNIRDERLVSREEFVGTIAQYMGLPMPKKVPEWLARSAVGVIEGFARLRGATTAPLLTNARIKFLTLNLDFSIAKAKQKLGYQPQIDFTDGMKTALDWAKSENLISAPASTKKAG